MLARGPASRSLSRERMNPADGPEREGADHAPLSVTGRPGSTRRAVNEHDDSVDGIP